MRDPGGELAERGQFLRLDQAILRGPKVVERSDNSLVRACTSSNSLTFWMAITAWSAKVVTRSTSRLEKGIGSLRPRAKALSALHDG